MNSSKFNITSLFLLIVFALSGQSQIDIEDSIIEEQEPMSSFWKPFTIELNTTSIYHGLSLEKQFRRNTFFRASLSSDFQLHVINSGIGNVNFMGFGSPIGNKISMGVLFNVVNVKCINSSLRTGLDFGLSQKAEEYFYMARITKAFVDVPVLLQIRFLKHYSIDIGIRSSIDRHLALGFDFSNGIFYDYLPATLQNNLHIGLRYTFQE